MTAKQLAGERAVDFVKNGMIVGLGSGTTVYYFLEKLGKRVGEGLQVTGVCTSEQTRRLAERWKIPYVGINEVDHIDLTVDGADEVDPLGNGIKGGGGALLFEKIVASISFEVIWVVEQRKLVDRLGAFPLPVEIMPFGHRHCLDSLERMGLNPSLRMSGDKIFHSDGGHFIVDIETGLMHDPSEVDKLLKYTTGVIEHGLFLDLVNKVVVANEEMADVITYR